MTLRRVSRCFRRRTTGLVELLASESGPSRGDIPSESDDCVSLVCGLADSGDSAQRDFFQSVCTVFQNTRGGRQDHMNKVQSTSTTYLVIELRRHFSPVWFVKTANWSLCFVLALL